MRECGSGNVNLGGEELGAGSGVGDVILDVVSMEGDDVPLGRRGKRGLRTL